MRTGLSLVVSLLLLLSSSANTFSLYTDMLKALTQQRSDMSTNVMTDFFRPRTYPSTSSRNSYNFKILLHTPANLRFLILSYERLFFFIRRKL
ncbi:hypothetical protein QR680_015750 [Steinernema hermaphroditum]|uniref:Uncharacterized protein n=1 Tax=Steinernema hermaphroditum TaxID=289476 RepID=A0AA39HAZ9_9BILA|nr:hypothetical protein QR680_015750 [Steinernema hermaphroditum]